MHRYTVSCITYAQAEDVVFHFFAIQYDFTTLVVVLDRIGDEIEQYLLEFEFIGIQMTHRELVVDYNLVFFCCCSHKFKALLAQCRQFKVYSMYLHVTGFNS